MRTFATLAIAAAAQAATILQAVQGNSNLSSLATAVAGFPDIVTYLNDSSATLTAFAPDNTAVDGAVAAGASITEAVLQHHVIMGFAVESTDLPDGPVFALMGDEEFAKVEKTANGVLIDDKVNVTTPDVVADNGVAHIVDGVIVPPKSLLDIVTTTPSLSTLLQAVEKAELQDVIGNLKNFTILAPENAGFPDITSLTKEQLQDILKYHVLLFTTFNADPGKYQTLSGEDVEVKIENNKIMVNDAEVKTPNVITAQQGCVHIISKVLMPPSPETTTTTAPETTTTTAPETTTTTAPETTTTTTPETTTGSGNSSTAAPDTTTGSSNSSTTTGSSNSSTTTGSSNSSSTAAPGTTTVDPASSAVKAAPVFLGAAVVLAMLM